MKVLTMIKVSFVLGIPYYLYRRPYYMTHHFISLSEKFDHPHKCRKILSQFWHIYFLISNAGRLETPLGILKPIRMYLKTVAQW